MAKMVKHHVRRRNSCTQAWGRHTESLSVLRRAPAENADWPLAPVCRSEAPPSVPAVVGVSGCGGIMLSESTCRRTDAKNLSFFVFCKKIGGCSRA